MNRSYIFKKFLLALVFLVLFFPLIQNNLNLFIVKKLKGDFKIAKHIDFSINDWKEGFFQQTEEGFLNENFGLRNTLVRFNNQLRFNFFSKTSNKETVFGKEGYFFAHTYIDSYTGKNFIGKEQIIKKCLLVKELQDSLMAHGQIFLPVLAPNKARILLRYLGEGVKQTNESNYDVYVEFFKKFKINYIDFNKYFLDNINTSKYPLFTKYGIHWSSYGHTFAADSIINYLNYNYGLNTPTMVWRNNITFSDSLRDLDYDIGEGMNLFVDQLPSEKVAYPIVSYKNLEKNKPAILVIGDSFNFGLEKTDFQNIAFSDYKFLYYFKEVIPYTNDPAAIYKLNLSNEIKNHKVILMVTTEHNLINYGWGFLEKATGLLNGKKSMKDIDYENKIDIMALNIKKDLNWFSLITKQAETEFKNVDTILFLHAKEAIDMELEKDKPDMKSRIKIARYNIKRDPNWMEQIKQKAKGRGISIDSMVTLDAIWLLKQN